jgi:hypothetical protein
VKLNCSLYSLFARFEVSKSFSCFTSFVAYYVMLKASREAFSENCLQEFSSFCRKGCVAITDSSNAILGRKRYRVTQVKRVRIECSRKKQSKSFWVSLQSGEAV